MNEIEKEVKKEMNASLEHLDKELRTLRSSRANPALLDAVKVEIYGTSLRLRDIANITVPEPRQLLITPFDRSNCPAIGKAIENAQLNLQPQVDATVVRINIPQMDESMRKEIVKQCKKKAEEAKISIREVRRRFNEVVRNQKTEGDIPEDLMHKLEKSIQELTDSSCKEVDEHCQRKEKEILEI